MDRESLRVIDQNNTVKSVMPSQISNKIEKRRHAVATDRNGSEIRQDDTVREIGGESRQGVILHIHRSFLFLHNREQTENSGIFVTRATNVATVAAKGGRVANAQSNGPDLSRMNPALQRNGGANGNSGGNMMPPKSFGRDNTIGKTVTIRKGPYKGLLGIIKDTTDNEARIELHTKNKTIQVAKDVLSFKDPITGNSISFHDFAGRGRGGARGGFGGATPGRQTSNWTGGRTPMAVGDGGRTPAWGAAPSRTPAWQGAGQNSGLSSRTPRWGQGDGGRTPAWGVDGGRTAYGGAGGVSKCTWLFMTEADFTSSERLHGMLVGELHMGARLQPRVMPLVAGKHQRGTTHHPAHQLTPLPLIPILTLGLDHKMLLRPQLQLPRLPLTHTLLQPLQLPLQHLSILVIPWMLLLLLERPHPSVAILRPQGGVEMMMVHGMMSRLAHKSDVSSVIRHSSRTIIWGTVQ